MPKHLLGIEQLSGEDLFALIRNGSEFAQVSERSIKKVPTLRGRTVINLFFESSTRTRTSFEIAGKRLSADVINVSSSGSSTTKGETFLDTAETLQAMSPDAVVVRHDQSGAAHFLARHLSKTCVVNAGDGMHEHPTQALLDCLSLYQHFASRKDGIHNLTVAIVGDVIHSRVARSNILAHRLLGNRVRLIGPPTLLPDRSRCGDCFGPEVSLHYRLSEGLAGADVVMCLRLQRERQGEHFIPSLEEYTNEYCVTERILSAAAPDAVVLHPGPVNRGVEVESAVIDGARSLVQRQVTNGVAIRMAVLFWLLSGVAEARILGESNQ